MTKTATAPTTHDVAVGTVFYRSWGYDQTNVNFYVVVDATAKCVRIQECGSRAVEDNGPQTFVVPDTSRRFGKVWTKRVGKRGGTDTGMARLAFNSYSGCYEWDGRPKYETGSGWGH